MADPVKRKQKRKSSMTYRHESVTTLDGATAERRVEQNVLDIEETDRLLTSSHREPQALLALGQGHFEFLNKRGGKITAKIHRKIEVCSLYQIC